ncbi:MAG: glycosyltransferase [Deltaproteobacteria bacterium]|nr:MAG: glycosyltransferase [Deltaproteobacteria bacterium]
MCRHHPQGFCPCVRVLVADSRDADARRQSWAADLFISLSDNIQVTFGLTPIGAMVAGMPVVVTDLDGYKETVSEEVDGFRIPTFIIFTDQAMSHIRGG